VPSTGSTTLVLKVRSRRSFQPSYCDMPSGRNKSECNSLSPKRQARSSAQPDEVCGRRHCTSISRHALCTSQPCTILGPRRAPCQKIALQSLAQKNSSQPRARFAGTSNLKAYASPSSTLSDLEVHRFVEQSQPPSRQFSEMHCDV